MRIGLLTPLSNSYVGSSALARTQVPSHTTMAMYLAPSQKGAHKQAGSTSSLRANAASFHSPEPPFLFSRAPRS